MSLSIFCAVGEKIFVNDDMVITVRSANAGQTKLDFDADKKYTIQRESFRMSKASEAMVEHAAKNADKPIMHSDIVKHTKEVSLMFNKGEITDANAVRLIRVLPGFTYLPEDYIIAMLEAVNSSSKH